MQAGALNSNFKNPHGLHNDFHYTTAYDMAMISKEAYSIPEFRKITSTTIYTFGPTNLQPELRTFTHSHNMLKYTDYYYDLCTGGKTGYTDEADSTLVTYAESNGLKLVCVVMKESGNKKYEDTINLLNYGFENFHSIDVPITTDDLAIPVYDLTLHENMHIGKINLSAEDNTLRVVVPNDISSSDVTTNYSGRESLTLPLDYDSSVGSLNLYLNDKLLGNSELTISGEIVYEPVATTVMSTALMDTSLHQMEEKNTIETHKNPPYAALFLSVVLVLITLLIIFVKIRKYFRLKNKNKNRNIHLLR